MVYRLKNSDFKPFLGILDRKVSDLWVYVGDGIWVYFWSIFIKGKCTRGGEEMVESVIECRGGIDRRNEEIWENRMDWYFCRNCCAKCIDNERK
nr:MAG TPA: hypothetical protein [Caudoviricetes sp.]